MFEAAPRRSRRVCIVPFAPLAALAVLLAPLPAFAHAPIAGVGAFWNGVAHPLIVPTHALALLALGLAMGLDAPRTSRAALPLFGGSALIAVLLAGSALPPALALLGLAVAGGLVVAFERASSVFTGLLAVATGLLVGLDSAPEVFSTGEATLARLGTAAGATMLVTLAGGASAALDRTWRRVGVRVLGSWIAAAALVLAAALSTAPGPPAV